MKYILAFAATMALLTTHARAVEFTVENRTGPAFVVVNKCGPAVPSAKRPFPQAGIGPGTTARNAVAKDSKPGSFGATGPGGTTIPAPPTVRSGGTPIPLAFGASGGGCSTGNCPSSTSARGFIFRR